MASEWNPGDEGRSNMSPKNFLIKLRTVNRTKMKMNEWRHQGECFFDKWRILTNFLGGEAPPLDGEIDFPRLPLLPDES
jgi:hypothetical protein